MSVRFSLIYPTRHRPAFISQALRFLEKQRYQGFEVIVSDNYIDPVLSCENECLNSPLANLKYVRPPKPVGMVANWNYAMQFATGDYVCYLTDKMFLLPDTLQKANICIEKSQAEIVSWVDNSYSPKKFPDYFGEGIYVEASSSVPIGSEYTAYDPLEELSKKGIAAVSRNEQDKSSYARGKICFGAYSHELCNKIVERSSALFHNVSPDYTSMILGLSLAVTAAEIRKPGIVHIHTNLSNGGLGDIHDDLALKFLNDLDNKEDILCNYLVPELYCSLHNCVAHDYLTLKKKYDLKFHFEPTNWLVYITEDLDIQGRHWSSPEVEKQQRALLRGYIDNLPRRDQNRYQQKLEERAKVNKRKSCVQYSRRVIKGLLPEMVIPLGRRLLNLQPLQHFNNIEDVLK